MDIKDLGKSQVMTKEVVAPPSYQRAASSIPSVKIPSLPDEPVMVDLETVAPRDGSETRAQLNQVITVVNVTSQATEDIRKLVDSIDGIVKQVDEGKNTPSRVPVLENEANSLVGEIRKIARSTSVEGVHPFVGDRVVLQVKEQLGRQLEIIFPTEASDAFGMGTLRFSQKDAILETKTKVAMAWRHIEELSQVVDHSSQEVQKVAESVEVALQNSSAAEASPHDLESAIRLAGDISADMSREPDVALKTVRQFPKTVINLLE